MCLKLAETGAKELNALFPVGVETVAFQNTAGDTDPAVNIDVATLLSTPELYMFSNHDDNDVANNHPLGQSYDKLQSYNIVNSK